MIPSGELGPVELEVFRHLFTALAEEMGASLRRSAHSPNIKERRDYSCALFAPDLTPVALGDHMPVHLGAMPMSVAAAIEELGPLADGDVVVLNDPFRGGTHLPDITLVGPVFYRDRLLGYVASRAHHSDVGGMSPGSMPLSQEIFQEGLRIPPVYLLREGARIDDCWRLILANVRTPVEREGDLEAQLAALYAGGSRLKEIADRRGADTVLVAMKMLVRYADRLLIRGIARIPTGSYSARDAIEDDGHGNGPLPICVTITVTPAQLVIDFAGTAPQTLGGVNAVSAITASATRYVVRCIVQALLDEELPAGGGSMEAVDLRLPAHSLVNASAPAGVAAGNVETSQRITDVLLMAFAKALPELIPAMSQGTMNNLTVGGIDPRTGNRFAYYETVGGGMGAGRDADGLHGVHTHMSNSLNTPIEALEHAYPFRVSTYAIRRGSGGAGGRRGGDGLQRDITFLGHAEVNLLSERRLSGPPGAQGGEDGAVGQNRLTTADGTRDLPGKITLRVSPGDTLSIRSPGGGGWGPSPAADDSEDPTTGAPTAGAPTAGAPTAGAPTAGAPTTGAPTAGAPTAGAPTAGAPTTGAPTAGDLTTGDIDAPSLAAYEKLHSDR